MSFERIRERRRSAADLLSLISFFNPQGIPEWILRRYSKSVAKTGDEYETDSAFDEDLDTLQAYSLITVMADNGMCKIYALVQFCTRVWLSSFSDVERWKQKFIRLMAREFPTGQFENWAKCQQLLPYIESLYNREPTGEESVSEWAHVLTNAAWYMWTRGIYAAAQDAAAKVITVRERVVGQDDKLMLISVSLLALVLRDQGKYDEAEKLNRRALEGREKELGEQHPATLTSVSNLALVLRDQGKYDEAEKLNRRALEGSEKELGEQHPDTLTSVSNLALVLQDQGKYDEAEKLNRRALEGREKELGEQHPSTLASVYNLAYLLHKRKQYEEASGLYQRACDGYKQKLGTQHPTTIACLNHFSAMQKETEQEGLGQSRTLIDNGKAALRETSTHGFTSLNSRGTTSEPASNRQKSKQGSLYTRLKRMIHREDI
jgi:tetratricopeptide (TPR) repeat protein